MVEARRVISERIIQPTTAETARVLLTEAEREDLLDIRKELHSLLTGWHLSPNQRIPDALYQDTSAEGKERFAHLSKNKMRKVWHTNVFLNVEFTEKGLSSKLPRAVLQPLGETRRNLITRIRNATDITVEFVQETTELVHRALAMLDSVLEPVSIDRTPQPVRTRTRTTPLQEHQPEASP